MQPALRIEPVLAVRVVIPLGEVCSVLAPVVLNDDLLVGIAQVEAVENRQWRSASPETSVP